MSASRPTRRSDPLHVEREVQHRNQFLVSPTQISSHSAHTCLNAPDGNRYHQLSVKRIRHPHQRKDSHEHEREVPTRDTHLSSPSKFARSCAVPQVDVQSRCDHPQALKRECPSLSSRAWTHFPGWIGACPLFSTSVKSSCKFTAMISG